MKMAVAEGFEPSVGLPHTRFRGVLLRPLGHATGEAYGPSAVRPKSRVRRPITRAAGLAAAQITLPAEEIFE